MEYRLHHASMCDECRMVQLSDYLSLMVGEVIKTRDGDVRVTAIMGVLPSRSYPGKTTLFVHGEKQKPQEQTA